MKNWDWGTINDILAIIATVISLIPTIYTGYKKWKDQIPSPNVRVLMKPGLFVALGIIVGFFLWKLPSVLYPPPMWYGFAQTDNSPDREQELKQNCAAGSNFQRIFVAQSFGSSFTGLCNSQKKKCIQVCDWRGAFFPCDVNERQHLHARLGLCQ